MGLSDPLSFVGVDFVYRSRGLLNRRTTPVFRDFSWQTPAGCTVLLGPNGAGKTTLLGLGSTALSPSAGTVRLGELDGGTHRRRMRRAIGWMPQQVRPVPGLTAREQVAFAGWLKGLSRSEAWEAAITALGHVGLVDEADRLATELSGGQQRRVAIAQLLVHEAEVVLLDEPTTGLDPAQRAEFRESMRRMAQTATVVVATHQVDDLTDLFDTVAVLDHGQIVFTGSPKEFIAVAPAGVAHRAEAAYAALVGPK